MRVCWALAAVAVVLTVTACASRLGPDGRRENVVDAKYLFKGDIDRVVDTNRAEVMAGLLRITDKLYRRNPREWRKGGHSSREEAIARLSARAKLPPPGLEDKQEAQAALLAFREDFTGDRVAALMYGLLTMVDAAFEHKEEFFLLDSLNEQKLYNCARNLEVALWKLSNGRDSQGALMLLSNETDAANPNLSFEREFGRMIGLLDFMSRVVSDRSGRGVTNAAHMVAKSVFLPVGFLK